MRTILLLRGAPASGKSTWIKENKLESYTLCADDIRTMYQSPVMNVNGEFEITQKNDKAVWKLLFELMESRMKRGEFIVIDATHNNDKMIKKYRDYCNTYKYTMFVKEFDTPLEVCIDRNSKREQYKRVPVESIMRCHRNITIQGLGNNINKIDSIDEINNFYVEDLSQYEKLIFIGDIHGCHAPLKEVFDKFNDYTKTAYIFVGDYIDRGIQNKEVMEFMLSIYSRKNVFCLEGNHENVLFEFSRGIASGKKSFEIPTKPQLAGIDLKEVKLFHKSLRQSLKIKFNDFNFIVTHGGLPAYPKQIAYISTEQLIKGIGNYDTEIDRLYHENINDNEGYIQIHGHRSLEHDYPTSISLEDEVEFGGNLKVLEVTKDELKTHYFKNDIWDKKLNEIDDASLSIDKSVLKTNNVDVNKLSRSKWINTKTFPCGISSLNFSRSAFKNKAWNSLTTKARGLFVDSITGDVVARSYEKFFNLSEHESTSFQSLEKNLKFPVVAWKKENGFLGILSHRNGEYLFCSKSTVQGKFADIFKKLFLEKIGNKYYSLLKIIIENNISLVFEVVDIIGDPHIIKYNENKLVFLGSFDNSLETTQGKDSKSFIEAYSVIFCSGIDLKQRLATLNSYSEMTEYIASRKQIDNIEGIVLEDAKGFMFKVKYDYYNEWKSCRYLVDNINRNNGYFEIRLSHSDLQAKFGMWYSKSKYVNTEKSIIELRDLYESEVK